MLRIIDSLGIVMIVVLALSPSSSSIFALNLPAAQAMVSDPSPLHKHDPIAPKLQEIAETKTRVLRKKYVRRVVKIGHWKNAWFCISATASYMPKDCTESLQSLYLKRERWFRDSAQRCHQFAVHFNLIAIERIGDTNVGTNIVVVPITRTIRWKWNHRVYQRL